MIDVLDIQLHLLVLAKDAMWDCEALTHNVTPTICGVYPCWILDSL